ncbi:hypothetical protein B0H34DRAFT_223386 [Crassisporium funariophilum]|nr:hypothetical protein B0H34DRAFT_223386 [Crassisporium funariophilum]
MWRSWGRARGEVSYNTVKPCWTSMTSDHSLLSLATVHSPAIAEVGLTHLSKISTAQQQDRHKGAIFQSVVAGRGKASWTMRLGLSCYAPHRCSLYVRDAEAKAGFSLGGSKKLERSIIPCDLLPADEQGNVSKYRMNELVDCSGRATDLSVRLHHGERERFELKFVWTPTRGLVWATIEWSGGGSAGVHE